VKHINFNLPFGARTDMRVKQDSALSRAHDIAAAAEKLSLEVADLGDRVTTITASLKAHHVAIADLVQMLTDEADDQE
jgi:glycine cleavage system regulatory protein